MSAQRGVALLAGLRLRRADHNAGCGHLLCVMQRCLRPCVRSTELLCPHDCLTLCCFLCRDDLGPSHGRKPGTVSEGFERMLLCAKNSERMSSHLVLWCASTCALSAAFCVVQRFPGASSPLAAPSSCWIASVPCSHARLCFSCAGTRAKPIRFRAGYGSVNTDPSSTRFSRPNPCSASCFRLGFGLLLRSNETHQLVGWNPTVLLNYPGLLSPACHCPL